MPAPLVLSLESERAGLYPPKAHRECQGGSLATGASEAAVWCAAVWGSWSAAHLYTPAPRCALVRWSVFLVPFLCLLGLRQLETTARAPSPAALRAGSPRLGSASSRLLVRVPGLLQPLAGAERSWTLGSNWTGSNPSTSAPW